MPRPVGDTAAIRARRSPRAVAFFTGVMTRQIRANFHALRLARPGVPALAPDRPIIVYSNHPSWWDPAVYIVLARRLFPNHAGFGPMDGNALTRYRFMERLGIFGIDTAGYRGAMRFLRIAADLLADPARMLWVTAQGEFVDSRVRPICLKPGLAHVLARNPRAVALPLALDYPFWQEKQPEALARFGSPVDPADRNDPRPIQQQLEHALTDTMNTLAADAIARDPARFDTLIAGRAGVGGLYDGLRHLSAAIRGQRFDPAHDRRDRP